MGADPTGLMTMSEGLATMTVRAALVSTLALTAWRIGGAALISGLTGRYPDALAFGGYLSSGLGSLTHTIGGIEITLDPARHEAEVAIFGGWEPSLGLGPPDPHALISNTSGFAGLWSQIRAHTEWGFFEAWEWHAPAAKGWLPRPLFSLQGVSFAGYFTGIEHVPDDGTVIYINGTSSNRDYSLFGILGGTFSLTTFNIPDEGAYIALATALETSFTWWTAYQLPGIPSLGASIIAAGPSAALAGASVGFWVDQKW
ncbi:MAG: hypothetical protein NTY19_23540 [Planctomycetota bacterium]|nr:hypothetical protein [Planctomycetota bacterium]